MPPTRFECSAPIFRVDDIPAAAVYYSQILGFTAAPWGNEDFTCVDRDKAAIYLCRRAQGHPGAWAWIGVEDAEALHAELLSAGAKVRHAPRNYPWALEFHVEDIDEIVLRFGSDPHCSRPYEAWLD